MIRAKLSDKEKYQLKSFWFEKFGRLNAAAKGLISINTIIECIGEGLVKEEEWIEISKWEPCVKNLPQMDGSEIPLEVSPFSDEFITYFWNKLKPLMTEENITKLKKHHKEII